MKQNPRARKQQIIDQNPPTISIVTPSFNQGTFLEATIESIVSQKYPNLEYIIIDGGSTDGSVDIIKKYEKYVKFWCSEPDNGHYDAINKGFSYTSGEIMAWLNSDDMYCPWALRTVADIFSTCPQVEWLTTLNPCIWDWYGFCEKAEHIAGYSKEAFLEGRCLAWVPESLGWIQQESTFWRRRLWERAGGTLSTDFALAGDFELWSRFYRHAELYGVASPLGGFRYHQEQKTFGQEEYIRETRQILNTVREQMGWSPDITRRSVLSCKLHKIPRLRKYVWSIYSYSGKRVVRRKSGTPEGFWESESYRFYDK